MNSNQKMELIEDFMIKFRSSHSDRKNLLLSTLIDNVRSDWNVNFAKLFADLGWKKNNIYNNILQILHSRPEIVLEPEGQLDFIITVQRPNDQKVLCDLISRSKQKNKNGITFNKKPSYFLSAYDHGLSEQKAATTIPKAKVDVKSKIGDNQFTYKTPFGNSKTFTYTMGEGVKNVKSEPSVKPELVVKKLSSGLLITRLPIIERNQAKKPNLDVKLFQNMLPSGCLVTCCHEKVNEKDKIKRPIPVISPKVATNIQIKTFKQGKKTYSFPVNNALIAEKPLNNERKDLDKCPENEVTPTTKDKRQQVKYEGFLFEEGITIHEGAIEEEWDGVNFDGISDDETDSGFPSVCGSPFTESLNNHSFDQISQAFNSFNLLDTPSFGQHSYYGKYTWNYSNNS